MSFQLPFMLTGRDGIACNAFLKEYFDSFADYAGDDFYTTGAVLRKVGDSYQLEMTVWLAPYDLGVSQQVVLSANPEADDPNVFVVDISLERISGDDNSWRRTNWLFINILRRQFLIWRTLTPAQKDYYAEEGRQALLVGAGGVRDDLDAPQERPAE
jgi:hypothetical protein